jgi:hypothetical protein
MINNYSEAYKDYYDKVRGKVKEKTTKIDKVVSTRDDIYPSISNVGNYSYRRDSYGVKSEKKKFKYIDRFIMRLICTFVLFLGVFTLRVLPNSEAKELYKICKSAVSSNFNYEKLLAVADKLGFDYKDILKNIEEKYTNVISEISNIKLEEINKTLDL